MYYFVLIFKKKYAICALGHYKKICDKGLFSMINVREETTHEFFTFRLPPIITYLLILFIKSISTSAPLQPLQVTPSS